jgi:aryl-alcohol dehydrogenase-like predicted oxidoreductase
VKILLVLGTVNFGMPYGPDKYQVPKDEIFKILTIADRNGLMLDTAAAYGDAETIIGNFGYSNKIITKLPPWCKTEDVFFFIKESLRKLRVDHLSTLLLHTESQIYDSYLVAILNEAKKRGYVDKIGVSVYNSKVAIDATTKEIDAIQIPFSIFDNVLAFTEFFQLTKENNITVYARSAFLQGYILKMPKNDDLDQKWPNFSKNMEIFEVISKKHGYTKHQISLLFSHFTQGINHIVVGVDSAEQLEANLEILNSEYLLGMNEFLGQYAIMDLMYRFSGLNYQIPSLWKEKTDE